MRIILVQIFLLSSVPIINAQNQTLDIAPASGSAGPLAIRFNDASHVKGVSGIAYSDITGRYFLDETWQRSLVKLKNASVQKFSKMRFNQYTKELHFMNNSKEMSAGTNLIDRVVFYDPSDSLSEKYILQSKTINGEVKLLIELNQGKLKLFKDELVLLEKGSYNVSLGIQEYRFIHKYTYYLEKGNDINLLKEFSKDAILRQCTDREMERIDHWLSKNNNKLKNEKSLLQFLNFYNKLE
ncbi:MAG: hypothetical protein HYZ44_01980 [Bacteroidetes bacterium]|nr:hypothetical protein [Bacteroidota bacterium]